MHLRHLKGLCLIAAVAGCGPGPRPPPVAPPPTVYTFSQFSFANKELGARAAAFDAAASRLAQGGTWVVESYQEPAWSRGDKSAMYVSRWSNSVPGAGGSVREIELTLRGPRERGFEEDRVDLYGRYYPEGRWGAIVVYQRHDPLYAKFDSFQILFGKVQNPARGFPGEAELRVPFGTCSGEFRNGNFSIVLEARAPPSTLSHDDRVRRFLSSAEEFRKAALEELDELDACVREQVASGQAWTSSIDWSFVRSDNPPQKLPPPAGATMSPDQQTQALDVLLKEVERRRTLIRNHHQELFDAAQEAFPLYECIAGLPSAPEVSTPAPSAP